MKFKVDDEVRVVADEKRLEKHGIYEKLTGKIAIVTKTTGIILPYQIQLCEGFRAQRWVAEQDLELAEPEQPTRTFVGHPDGELEVKDGGWTESGGTGPPIRTFDTGATRDTDRGKLDYVKALSPIVLRRYVQYLNKHRLQPDGSYRDFDNWKKGMDQGVYHSSGGRHFFDAWLLTEGYTTEDNHGPAELEDVLCAQLFNLMGRLHEILKAKVDRTKPVSGGY